MILRPHVCLTNTRKALPPFWQPQLTNIVLFPDNCSNERERWCSFDWVHKAFRRSLRTYVNTCSTCKNLLSVEVNIPVIIETTLGLCAGSLWLKAEKKKRGTRQRAPAWATHGPLAPARGTRELRRELTLLHQSDLLHFNTPFVSLIASQPPPAQECCRRDKAQPVSPPQMAGPGGWAGEEQFGAGGFRERGCITWKRGSLGRKKGWEGRTLTSKPFSPQCVRNLIELAPR